MNTITRFTGRGRGLAILLLGMLALTALFAASPTAANSPPDAPTGLTANRSAGQIVVSWNASSGATGYNLVVSQDGKHSWTRVVDNQNVTTYTHTGVDHTLIYHVAVQATNNQGSSGWRNSAQISPYSGGD